MKKSKHFRKDVIMARIIAAVILLVLIGLIVFGVSLLRKSSGNDKNSQNSQNTQNMENEVHENTEGNQQLPSSEIEDSEVSDSEETEDTGTVEEKVFIETTAKLRLRKEPNTNCETLDRISSGTRLEVLETLDGWYKVSYNGQEGYVSATYTKIVEE